SHVIILLSIVRAYDDIRFTKAAALYHCMMLIFSFSSFNFIVIPYSTTFSFLLLIFSVIFFFFSSRRRHTRCYRDWSSDVCSSDLVIYHNFEQLLEFRIGDVRDYHSVAAVLRVAEIVFNAAALKQVPACEYFPYEA